MTSTFIATAAAIVGFLAGFTTFKRSMRWCKACGAGLTCAHCAASVRNRLRVGH